MPNTEPSDKSPSPSSSPNEGIFTKLQDDTQNIAPFHIHLKGYEKLQQINLFQIKRAVQKVESQLRNYNHRMMIPHRHPPVQGLQGHMKVNIIILS